MSGVKKALDPNMTVERLISNPVRAAILKSILSRENASVSRQIKKDLPDTNTALLQHHLNILAKYKIVYKCWNYITNWGYFYSIYWSDEADQAVKMVEEV